VCGSSVGDRASVSNVLTVMKHGRCVCAVNRGRRCEGSTTGTTRRCSRPDQGRAEGGAGEAARRQGRRPERGTGEPLTSCAGLHGEGWERQVAFEADIWLFCKQIQLQHAVSFAGSWRRSYGQPQRQRATRARGQHQHAPRGQRRQHLDSAGALPFQCVSVVTMVGIPPRTVCHFLQQQPCSRPEKAAHQHKSIKECVGAGPHGHSVSQSVTRPDREWGFGTRPRRQRGRARRRRPHRRSPPGSRPAARQPKALRRQPLQRSRSRRRSSLTCSSTR